jgi:tetratricopeptide (TPR) repeat protein
MEKSHFDRGLAFFYSENYEEAIIEFSKAIDLNPMFAETYYNRGLTYRKLPLYDNDKALDDYSKAIDLNPMFAEAYYNRGVIYNELTNYDKALDDYSKAIGLNPMDAKAYYNRGLIYHKLPLPRYDKALDDYSKAIELDPMDAEAYCNRGVTYVKLTNYEEALNDFNKAIELNPRYAYAYYCRGNAYDNLQQYEASHKDYTTSLYLADINSDVDLIANMVLIFKEYPKNLEYLLIKLFESKTVHFTSIKEPLLQILDFKQLLTYFENCTTLSEKDLLSIKSIAYYYLGGSVPAFIIFDNELDNGEDTLSAQELYYYAKSAIDVNWETESTLHNCIVELTTRNNKTDIDFYYLAHLHLLDNNKEKAVNCFLQSKKFNFSALMYSYLTGNFKFDNNFLTTLILKAEIDITKRDLSQFQDYFHYTECITAIDIERNDYEPNFWDAFRLDIGDKQYIINILKKFFAEKIINLKIEEHGIKLHNIPEEKREEIKKDLEYKLNEIKKGITELTDFIDNAIAKNRDIANQIGLCIEEIKYQPKSYIYIIHYYYFKEKINPSDVFILIQYLIKTFFDKKKTDIIDEILNIIPKISNAFVPYAGIKLIINSGINIKSILKNAFKDFYEMDDELKGVSDYNLFKENLWKIIAFDKENLTDEQFENKYGYFEWFDNY